MQIATSECINKYGYKEEFKITLKFFFYVFIYREYMCIKIEKMLIIRL